MRRMSTQRIPSYSSEYFRWIRISSSTACLRGSRRARVRGEPARVDADEVDVRRCGRRIPCCLVVVRLSAEQDQLLVANHRDRRRRARIPNPRQVRATTVGASGSQNVAAAIRHLGGVTGRRFRPLTARLSCSDGCTRLMADVGCCDNPLVTSPELALKSKYAPRSSEAVVSTNDSPSAVSASS